MSISRETRDYRVDSPLKVNTTRGQGQFETLALITFTLHAEYAFIAQTDPEYPTSASANIIDVRQDYPM